MKIKCQSPHCLRSRLCQGAAARLWIQKFESFRSQQGSPVLGIFPGGAESPTFTRVSLAGAGLCLLFSNFRFGMAETSPAPLDNWRLAACVHRLRRLMEARMGTAGRREFIQGLRLQVLRLMEDFHQHQVEQAVSEALRPGSINFDAVKMLLLARLKNRPARLDLTFYPYLPATTVGTPDPRAYLGLIAGQDSGSLGAGAKA